MRSRFRAIQRVVRIASEPPADLTLGAALDPEQSLASSATTATVEWPAASGGTAPYTYAISVKDEAGSSVTPNSGSANGPYVIPVAAGKSYSATLGVTDANGQVAHRTAMVHVAAAAEAALGWETLADYDFTGLDTAVLTGTGYVQKSGVNYGPQYKVVDYSSNLGTVTAGSTGIVVDGLNINSGLNLTFGLADVPAITPDTVVCIDLVLVDVAEIDSGSDGLRVGFVDSGGNFSAGTRCQLRGNYVSAGVITWQTETDGTATTWQASQTLYATYTVTLLLIGGFIVQVFRQDNSETLPSDETIAAGGRTVARNIAAGSSGTFDATARFGINAIWGTKCTIKRARIRQRGGVLS